MKLLLLCVNVLAVVLTMTVFHGANPQQPNRQVSVLTIQSATPSTPGKGKYLCADDEDQFDGVEVKVSLKIPSSRPPICGPVLSGSGDDVERTYKWKMATFAPHKPKPLSV